MGEVYLAEDGRLRRKVALKVLPDTLSKDAERLRRFEQEALAASALNHPNILTIFEFGEEGGTHYLASEFIDGETLRERLQRSPLSVNETLDIVIQTVQALSAAHEAGIIHRDIKPENVMLRKDGIVKVLDFGLAKLVETTPTGSEEDTRKQGMTREGTVMGTVAYMSPEQARGKAVDARTDQFSLGVMLYEMLSRRQPFTGETFNHVIVAILEKEPTPLAGIPSELKRILEKALAKNAADRYSDAKAMLGELKKLQTRLLVEAETGGKPEKEIIADTLIEGRTAIMSPSTVSTSEVVATAPSGQPTSPDTAKQMKWWIATALSLLLAVGGFFGYRKFFPAKQIESIAVMPFVNESGNADVEYLSDGMTETLISSLSNIPNLSVKARSTVFFYKGKDTSTKKIGEELKVQAVLLGRVSQRNGDLKLSLELVNTETQDVIWSETYNRKQADITSLQSEIAQDVSTKLKTRLSGSDQAKVTKSGTANPEAYQAYLKGRYYWNRRTPEGIQKAIEQFKLAVQKDPNYALAYVGLADCYGIASTILGMSVKESLQQAKAYATKALEIDNSLGEAYATLGLVHSQLWNWAEAENAFKRSIELNPNYASARHWNSRLLNTLGRKNEAFAEIRRANEIDPLSMVIINNIAGFYREMGDYKSAVEQCNKIKEIDSSYVARHVSLTEIYLDRRQSAQALAEVEKIRDFPSLSIELSGRAYAQSGRRNEALAVIRQLEEGFTKGNNGAATGIARVYVALGDKEKGLEWLEKAFQAHETDLPRSRLGVTFDPIRDDPRYKDLLKRMGLPE